MRVTRLFFAERLRLSESLNSGLAYRAFLFRQTLIILLPSVVARQQTERTRIVISV